MSTEEVVQAKPVYAKQVIVVRTDLNMPVGKIAAQVAHAAMAPITNRLKDANEGAPVFGAVTLQMSLCPVPGNHDLALLEWITGSFTKVVVKIEGEQELRDLIKASNAAGIPCVGIEDEGRTVFNGVRTLTCASFGPAYSDVLDELTGHLKLLRK